MGVENGHLERKTADAILQSDFRVLLGGAAFKVAPPSNATIIRLSALVSLLPDIRVEDERDILNSVLLHAKRAGVIGDIMAALICGEAAPARAYDIAAIWTRLRRAKRYRKVKRHVLYRCSPKETLRALGEILARQEIGDFFVLTTSLSEANYLKATREVDKKTTVSG